MRKGDASSTRPRSLLEDHPFGAGHDMHTCRDPDTDDRFLSRSACRALADRVFAMGRGGGTTQLLIWSQWAGNLRWARNDVTTGGDTRQSTATVSRWIRDAGGEAETNVMTDDGLRACVERAEALTLLHDENPDDYPDGPPATHPHLQPHLWFDRTAAVDATTRATAAAGAMDLARAAGVVGAGYLEVGAAGRAVIDTRGLFRYYPVTTVQYSITMRDPAAQGSGWAGVDWNDWARVDAEQLVRAAVDKCERSRNPVAAEPGRFTALLEPQAVCDLVAPLIAQGLSRQAAELGRGPFADPARPGYSRLGQRVVDPRITIHADPMDPDCGFLPFDWAGEPYQPVTWIRDGILSALEYDRGYGLRQLNIDAALPNSGAFHMSGGTATPDAMIASIARGVLVTRFDQVRIADSDSMLSTGVTRDGLWLIERGVVTKAIKNFRFVESPIFALNNVVALGAPRRVFHPYAPAIVPSLIVRDFNFTGLVDAV